MSFFLRPFFFLICLESVAYASGQLPVAIRINDVLVLDTAFVVKPSQSGKLAVRLSQRSTDMNLYEYRLEGIDKRWITYQQIAYLSYFQLPGGSYQLMIRKKGDLVPLLKVWITIEPLLWQKWWFLPSIYFCAFLILASGLYFVYLYRLHQQVRLLNVRENIARDLHDDMGSYLGSISILSQSVQNLSQKDPQHARLLVDKIGETARQVMDSMSDIVWSINPDNDSMAQVIVRMRDVATDLLGAQDVNLHVDIDEVILSVHLPLEQRRDFFLIYKEALTNLAKYASASHVWVKLQRNGSSLLLTMQDDGVGFDPQQIAGRNPLGGNGIKNMKARAEKMGGTLSIKSAVGQGTTLLLQILLP